MAEELIREGKAEGKVETLLTILRARFKNVPGEVESAVRRMIDPISLDSWAAQAATCRSMDEFVEMLR